MVQDHKLLTNKIEEWQPQWNLLSEQLTALTASRIRETRPEEKLRLKGLIDEAEAEREQVEQKLTAAQEQLAKLDGHQTAAINPPRFQEERIRALSDALEAAYEEREEKRAVGQDITVIQQKILELKRQ